MFLAGICLSRALLLVASAVALSRVEPMALKSSRGFNGKLEKNRVRHADDIFQEDIRRKWDDMFNHQKVFAGNISVITASVGEWTPSPDCQTPLFWIFLEGQYRSFDYTRQRLAQIAKESSNDCFFVAAVIPEEAGTNFEDVDVPSKLKEAQIDLFGGRMAYVVVHRSGLYDRDSGTNESSEEMFEPPSQELRLQHGGSEIEGVSNLQGVFDFLWSAVYHCADFAAKQLEFEPSPHSVVMRIRPDIELNMRFNFENLTTYFRDGQRGYHLAFGGEVDIKQADIYMITSFEGYKNDIAEAYEHSVWTARNNGAGYGWSICGWRSLCSMEQADGKVVIKGPIADNPLTCKERPLDYVKKDCCNNGSCPMTILWHLAWNYVGVINRGVDVGSVYDGVVDLTNGAILNCPVSNEGMEIAQGWGGTELPLYASDTLRATLDQTVTEDLHYYRSTYAVKLLESGRPANVWPDGC